jgi:hypothetical protein
MKRVVWTVARIALVWVSVSVGYHALLPLLGFTIGYNSHPFLNTTYNAVWLIVTIGIFRDVFLAHVPHVSQRRTDIYVSVVFGFAAALFLWALSLIATPHLPSIEPATDLLLATPWYFLPKSVEILLQQVLIAAFVFELDRQGYSLRTIIFTYAVAFGATHLLLIFGGAFPPTVLIMTLAAVISATMFPYLLLRTRRGFLWCFIIHWWFYALLVLVLRFAA